ncbi:MAG: hypothetical protein CVV44_16475 [Spirochaetae bacterium HGW-Spirochaetae-1]|jgi:AcrR family transcriptional regulator|nr:MAG: hypothetical protein CVV44_16475 [Spirochaetae bacterium HGW-Spirochaetae-1]
MNEKSKSEIINIRRSQLIKAAYRVLSKKGYHDFTIRDIAKEANLSTGLVHYYFKNKQDLLVSVLKDINENLRRFLDKSFEQLDSPVEKLRVFMTHAFELAKDEEYFSVIFDFWTLSNNNDRMHRANMKLLKSYRDECRRIIEEGIRQGVFNTIDVEYTTAIIISVIQGMIIQYVIDKGAFDYDEYAEKVTKQIFVLLVKKDGNKKS